MNKNLDKIQTILKSANQEDDGGWKISNEDFTFLCFLLKVALNLETILKSKDVTFKGTKLTDLEKERLLEIITIMLKK